MAKRIASPEDLKILKEKSKGEIEMRVGAKDVQVTVHMGTCGIAAGARDVLSQLAADLNQAKATNVLLKQAGCAGLCDREPMITVVDKSGKEYRYGKLDKGKVREIVRDHILGGKPLMNYVIAM
jgi:NADP-reducing hydrogenase subunit HndB